MRSVFNLVKEQFTEDFKWSTYGYLIFFLVLSISFNYVYDFEDSVLDSYLHSPLGFIYYSLFYAVGYYGVAIPQLFILKQTEVLKQPIYWLKTGFFLLVCGFSASFYLHWFLQDLPYSFQENRFIKHIVMNLSCFFTTLVPLFVFWLLVDKKTGVFYGFRFKNANLKPYFIMLGLMFPLLLWASFQEDFQATYPTLKAWTTQHPFGMSDWQSATLFELVYGISFVCVETLFRGALIVGVAQLLGRNAILPMVSLYAFLHFGKPLGETIGSVFGAYILGTIALKKEHILGGIIIHIGVALTMDLLAYFQYYVVK